MTQPTNPPNLPKQAAVAPTTQTAHAAAGAQIAQISNSQNVNIYFGSKLLLRTHLPAPSTETLQGLQWLMPQNRATELVGREAELTSLREWLEDPRPTLLRCITGDGGRGKTRLGIEACELAISLGFGAGLALANTLDAIALTDGWHELVRTQPCLVVIDYAASRTHAINSWLGALAEPTPSADANPPKLRILLLERHASVDNGWYSDLFTGGYSSYAKRALFNPLEPIALPALHSAEQRRAVLAALHAKLPHASAAPLPNDSSFNQELANNPDAGDPLWLMMLAFALHSGSGKDDKTANALFRATRQELALDIVRQHEAPRIAARAKSRGMHEQFALYLCACVTLLQGYRRSALAELAGAEMPLLSITSQGGFDQAQLIAAALGEAGSGENQEIQAIGPDLIGEAFVLHVLNGTFKEQASAALVRLQALAPFHVSQSLVRTAQDFGLLAEGACSLLWLAHLVEQLAASSPELAVLDATIPAGSTALRPINQLVSRKLAANVSSASSPEQRAALLNNQAIAEAQMGNAKAALAAGQEAVALYRALAQQRPDAFTPALAASLNNLAIVLSNLGQREAALDAAQEAVALRRTLAQQRPDAFTPDLASSLNNLASCLSDLGQREAALEAAQEAAALYRALAQQRPDAFTPNLATSLKVLALRTHEAGGEQAAMAASQLAAEAIGLLTPYFVALPQAHAGLMGSAVRDYLGFCQAAGLAPDADLLDPLMPVFERLQAEE